MAATLTERVAWRPRPMDVVWVVLFAALAVASPIRNEAEMELLALLAVVQILEPRIPFLATRRGALLSVGIKLMLGYLLVGVTGAINSTYYLILLVPVVSAVTTMGALGFAVVSFFACGAYLSFLLVLDWNRYQILPGDVRELALRVLLFVVLAVLMHQLAASVRAQSQQYLETAKQLADANRSLAEAEAAVRRSERLAAIGQLMAGLAHELRNPLGTMKASAEMLLKQLPEGEPVPRELAGYIREEVDRTNSLVTRFLDFARPLELRPSKTDVNELLDAAISQLQRRTPAPDVTFYRNYSPDVHPVMMDGELMERVFYNLLLNAAEASPAGGAITVKTRPLADGVEVAVIDRGPGIDTAHLENIFNPFFTTKPTGTGLGLAIVSKIVDQHGGKVLVESEPGQGTVFRVRLGSQAEVRA
ncbi:MAG: ATP-binding protein [Bryobacteraceae bacterium]